MTSSHRFSPLRGVSLVAALLLLAAGCESGDGNAPKVTALSRNTHAAFPIASGAHGSTDCNACHGAFDTFQRFTCLSSGCHPQAQTDGNHSGVPGYGYESAKCYSCHRTGSGEVEHSSIFPIKSGETHGGLACADCHTDATDRKQVTCDACHSHPAADMPAKHTAVSNFAAVSSQCLRCHGDSQVARVASHLPFRIGGSSPHAQASCFDCHPGMRQDKPFAADFTASGLSCLTGGCHANPATDAQHTAVSGYEHLTARCYACHPDGTGAIDHTRFFPIANTDTHAAVACSDCHTNASDRKTITCNACHSHAAADMPAKHTAVYGFASVAAQCLRCHADSQVDRVANHFFRITSSSSHRQSACFDCHPRMRTDKTWAADFSAAGVNCLQCHSRSQTDSHHDEVSGYVYQSASCIKGGCHADGLSHGD